MKPTHNITIGESYEKNGEQKTRWTNIGVIMTGEKNGKQRTVVKLNVVPLGWDGFANVFPIEKKDGKTAVDEAREAVATGAEPDYDDRPIDLSEIPF